MSATRTVLALFTLLLCCAFIGSVSGEDVTIVIDDTIVDSSNYHIDSSLPATSSKHPNYFRVEQSENYKGGVVLIWFSDNIINNNESIHSNQTSVAVMKGKTIIGNGTLGYYRDSTKAGYIFLDFVWEVPQSGRNTYYIRSSSDLGTFASYSLDNLEMGTGNTPVGEMSDTLPAGFHVRETDTKAVVAGDYTLNTFIPFRHNIEVTEHTEFADRINVYRVVDGTPYESIVSISGKSGEYLNSTGQTNIEYQIGNEDRPYHVAIYNMFGEWYYYDIFGGASPSPGDNATVTVYVRNSQTGALLADAHIEIQDTTTDPWTEVVNQTLPSGQGTFSLPKDPGFDPTQYRIGATVPGYQQVVPALFFRVTGPTNVVVEMEPLEGGPVDENNTFLEFYVRDLNANGIPNANVLVDGQLRWTNAQGYTQIEVAKNASYPYSVSKSGYVTIEGRATVADGPRYVVNVVLGPGTVPTYTPGDDPGATPPPRDTRTNEEKGKAVIDLLADNAELIATLAILAAVMGLINLIMPGRRRR